MKYPYFIARKYFFSGKVSNLIHLISGVSMTGIMIGAFALIVILSVFNGLEKLVLSLYNRFDSDIRIELAEGKYFNQNDAAYNEIREMDEVLAVTGIIEESLMIRYDNFQSVATFRAMSPDYMATTGMDTLVFRGYSRLDYRGSPRALIGAGIANQLNVSVYDEMSRMHLYMPKAGTVPVLRPERGFNRKNIAAGGVFAIQQEFDEEYIIIPLDFARELTEQDEDMVTAVEVNLREGASLTALRDNIAAITGPDFDVKDRYQQHAILYRILRSERMAVYLILTFILVVASFNMVGALLMLAIEKRKDMAILSSMGARSGEIRQVFYWEGGLLSVSGGIVGLLLGGIVCWIQIQWGIVKLGTTGTFVVEAYPVVLNVSDFILVFLTVLAIGILASVFPAWAASKNVSASDLHD